MCYGCWEQEGGPSIISDKTKNAARLWSVADEECGIGAHIVLDDWNLETSDIKWCLNSGECNQQEIDALNALLPLTRAERYSAAALVDGFINSA